jgi:hypothetical protein
VLNFFFFVALGFVLGAYAIGWSILVVFVNVLGWIGVPTFPKPFPWWMPFIACGLAVLVQKMRK